MEIQISLTVNEAKRLIAKGVVALPQVQAAFKKAKILLKGGTTVSAVSEALVGMPLRISGRITSRGTVAAKDLVKDHPHSVLIENGQVENIDDTFAAVAQKLSRQDVVIIGGNALDVNGNAAMMAGAAGGGNPGQAIPGILTQGCRVIIPVGLEKMIPGAVSDAIQAAGRDADLAYGMAVGLIPLIGKVVTEKDAVEIVSAVRCTVIGRGGILGAEGSTVMAVEGGEKAIAQLLRIVNEIKGLGISGLESSLDECDGRGANCRDHRACIYKGGKKSCR